MRPLILFSPARVAATISHHHPRHRRENGGPVITGIDWIPAFRGDDYLLLGRFVLHSLHRRKERQRRAVGRLEHHLDLLADLQLRHIAVDEIGQ